MKWLWHKHKQKQHEKHSHGFLNETVCQLDFALLFFLHTAKGHGKLATHHTPLQDLCVTSITHDGNGMEMEMELGWDAISQSRKTVE